MTTQSRSSSLETIYQQGYSKGLSGGTKDACPAHIRYAKDTHNAWLEGWKAGRTEGNHPIPRPWIPLSILAIALSVVVWALFTWIGGEEAATSFETAESSAAMQVINASESSNKTSQTPNPSPTPVETTRAFGFASSADMTQAGWLDREAKGINTLYFVATLENKAGETLTHTWYRDGQQVGQVSFTLKSNHFTTVSQRALKAQKTEVWSVKITDGQGNTLAEQAVTVSP